MNKVQCDHCENIFTITEIKTEKSHRLSGNITRHYFECPGCGYEYTSYFLDDEMRDIQFEIRLLENKENLKQKQRNKLMKLTTRLANLNAAYLKVYNEMLADNVKEEDVNSASE